MNNPLDNIISFKKRVVKLAKSHFGEDYLIQKSLFVRDCNSLKKALSEEGASGIIAEFKTRSPSKGIINGKARVEQVTSGYARAGASGLSVLTDSVNFGGDLSDLMKARMAHPNIPILRKDFMIDPFQIIESKAYGADVILLIASILTREQVHQMAVKAKDLGMEVLLEIHERAELDKISPSVDLVGVNNRDLKTFKVSVKTSRLLAPLIPEGFVCISESGLTSPKVIAELRNAGYKGFLIGERFMKCKDPGKACENFIRKLRSDSL